MVNLTLLLLSLCSFNLSRHESGVRMTWKSVLNTYEKDDDQQRRNKSRTISMKSVHQYLGPRLKLVMPLFDQEHEK